MSLADVRTFRDGEVSALVITHGIWAERRGKWIHIHMTGPEDSHTTVTNDPNSVRYHRTLFRDLRRALIHQRCWLFGEEGSETLELEVDSDQPASRFSPVPILGEPLSATIIRDRGED